MTVEQNAIQNSIRENEIFKNFEVRGALGLSLFICFLGISDNLQTFSAIFSFFLFSIFPGLFVLFLWKHLENRSWEDPIKRDKFETCFEFFGKLFLAYCFYAVISYSLFIAVFYVVNNNSEVLFKYLPEAVFVNMIPWLILSVISFPISYCCLKWLKWQFLKIFNL